MTTRKTTTPKPIVYPTVDPKLLAIVRDIYKEYTGQQFADAVAEVRREITAEQEKQALQEQMAKLQEKIDNV